MEVRVHGIVHVNSVLPEGAAVPIGWMAQILPPARHEEIWAVQEGLDFPGTVYGLPRDAPAGERMQRQTAWYGEDPDVTPR